MAEWSITVNHLSLALLKINPRPGVTVMTYIYQFSIFSLITS
jgi:hypothetical protein